MLAFRATAPSNDAAAAQLFQLASAGVAGFEPGDRVLACAAFNRVAGTPASDGRFQVFLHGYEGSMRHFSEVYGLQAAFGPARAELDSDAQPETWEPICVDVAITVPVDYFAIELRAIENTVDGPPGDEFDGHFVDDACLFVNPG